MQMMIRQNFEIKAMKMRLVRQDFSGLIQLKWEKIAAKGGELC